MRYDIQIVLPVCRNLSHRLADFKKYGLLNTSGRKVLVTAITSNQEDVPEIENGWPEEVEIKVKKNRSPNYVSNIYRFYADLEESSLESRWIVRIDDDSCTDVGGLLDNLDMLYDWEDKFYLGDLSRFENALLSGEMHVYPEYSHLLGKIENIAPMLRNEIECGIISRGGMVHMLKNEACMNLIRQRSELHGGFGDCVTALAATLAKLHPIQCPFVSYLPLISDFSIFGGHLNHIHMISKNTEGSNFHDKCGDVQYEALIRRIENKVTELESKISGKKFVMETERELSLYEFYEDKTAKIKFDNRRYIWIEHEGSIKMFCDAIQIHRILTPDRFGNLRGHGNDGEEIVLKPIQMLL